MYWNTFLVIDEPGVSDKAELERALDGLGSRIDQNYEAGWMQLASRNPGAIAEFVEKYLRGKGYTATVQPAEFIFLQL